MSQNPCLKEKFHSAQNFCITVETRTALFTQYHLCWSTCSWSIWHLICHNDCSLLSVSLLWCSDCSRCAVFLSFFCEICTGNRLVIFIWKMGRWLCLEWDVISPFNVSEVINQISHSRAHHVHVNPKCAETSRSLCFSGPDINLILFEITVFYLYKVSV